MCELTTAEYVFWCAHLAIHCVCQDIALPEVTVLFLSSSSVSSWKNEITLGYKIRPTFCLSEFFSVYYLTL